MAALGIRNTWFSRPAANGGVDLTTPIALSAVGAATSVAITFNEALRTGPAFAQFTVTAGGVGKAVSAASVAGAVLTLTVATLGGAGLAIVVTYAPGGTPATRLADNSARNNEVPAGQLIAYTS